MSKGSMVARMLSGLWRGITRLRLALSNLLFIAVLVLLFMLFTGPAPVALPDKAALRINLAGAVVDQKSYRDPLLELIGDRTAQTHQVLLRDLLEAIRIAKTDPSINSLVLETGNLYSLGISKTLEIAQVLEDFKSSGKPVIAVGDYYTQGQYLLASYADTVILNPYGGVALEGFASYRRHYREALEKLSVTMHVFRAGPHKSIAEPWLRDDMSEGEKAISQRWLDDLWRQYTDIVEAQRGLPSGAVNDYIDNYHSKLAEQSGDPARLSVTAGLVDKLMNRNQTNDYLISVVGAEHEKGHYQALDFEYYLERKRGQGNPGADGKIAVITAQGSILTGNQPPGAIGGDSLARELRKVQEDEDVDALVLRVTSGGGSTFASEIIRQAVLDIKAQGIPMVVSMGSVAASGGYYIAAHADEIVATPATITGSIGVFAALPTFENLLDWAGVHVDGVGTTELAGSARLDRRLNPKVASALQQGVDHVYREFLALVAEGRGMTVDEVDAVAGGRVWSAGDARDNGLVDTLGSLRDAIEIAASYAELETWEVDYVEPELSTTDRLLQRLLDNLGPLGLALTEPSPLSVVQQIWRPFEHALSELTVLNDPGNIYARCLACVVSPYTAR